MVDTRYGGKWAWLAGRGRCTAADLRGRLGATGQCASSGGVLVSIERKRDAGRKRWLLCGDAGYTRLLALCSGRRARRRSSENVHLAPRARVPVTRGAARLRHTTSDDQPGNNTTPTDGRVPDQSLRLS